MPQKKSRISTEQMRELQGQGVPVREIAKRAGISHPSVLRRLSVDKIRRADDFRGLPDFTPPRRESAHTSWSLDSIRAARDAQMNGVFKLAVRLAEAMRTDDSIFVARRNRLAPQSSIALTLEAHDSARGRAVARKAALGVKIARPTIASLHSYLVDNGIAIGYNKRTTNDEGTRVDFEHIAWPLEHVRWNASKEVLETPTRGGVTVPIIHGDGNWTIYRKHQVESWKEDAAVLPGSLVWASHAEGLLDWNATTRTHALAKLIGELPSGVPMQQRNPDGSLSLTPEAEMFGRMLGNLMAGVSQVGIRPSGSKTEFEANPSTAWQVIDTLITNREKAATRIFLGTDALLGAQGGAPGVDIAALFAVASAVFQSDFECLESGFWTGVYQPWTAINIGDSALAPCLEYQLPDPDLSRKIEEESKKHTAFSVALKEHRDSGFVVDQTVVDSFAKIFQIDPVPKLATTAPPAVAPAAPTPKTRGLRVRAGTYDESKHPRADDGKFGSGGGSSGGGTGGDDAEAGGSEGDGPKGGGDDTDAAPKDRKAVAEKRLGQAREQHTRAVEAQKVAEDRFERAKADGLAKLDAREQERAKASARAKAYADELDAEEKALDREHTQVQKDAKKAGVAIGPDDDEETHPHRDHPLNVRRREIESRLSELEDAPTTDLRREAKANARPDKRLAKARAALEAGDLDTFEKYESGAGAPDTEFSDGYGIEHDVRKAYRKEHGVGRDSEDKDVKALASRERAKREAARPDLSVSVSPDLGSPEDHKTAEARARKRWVDSGFQGEPSPEELQRMTEAQFNIMARKGELHTHFTSDIAPARDGVQKAKQKVDRAARAVRVHEREVKRVGGKVDGDGDGKTGGAEKADDSEPT